MYVGANILSAIVPFVLLPVLTRYLTPADYGRIAMFQVLVGLVGPIVGLSVHGAVLRKYFDVDRERLAIYISNCLLVLMTSTAAVAALLLLTGEQVSELTDVPRVWLWAVVAVSAGQFLGLIRLSVWQAGMEPVPYGVFQVSQTLLNLGASVLLVIGAGLGWEGRVLGMLTAYCGFGLIALALLARGGLLKADVRRSDMSDAVRFGAPLVPHTLAVFAIAASDRIFITEMIGVAETGVYMVGLQVAMGLALVLGAFNKAWAPWLFGRLKEGKEEVRRLLVGWTYVYFAAVIIIAVGIAALTPFLLPILVGPEFTRAQAFVVWLALGYAFDGMYMMVGHYLFYARHTGRLATATVAAAVVNVGLNYPLISAYGALGAAYATVIAFCLKFLLTWWMSWRMYPMPWGRPLLRPVRALN